MATYSHSIKPVSYPIPWASKPVIENDIPISSSNPTSAGSSLTGSELRSNGTLISDRWQLDREHKVTSIGQLAPGSRRVFLTVRVVNLHEQVTHSKMQKSARGCLKILANDDSALILIDLWYAKTVYDIRLGSLLKVWTTHVSSTSTTAAAMESTRAATLMISIFPERDASCHIEMIDEADAGRSIYNKPLGHVSGRPLLGLISLKAFIEDGGDEVLNAKILVCVHSIGATSTSTSSQDQALTTLSVHICDESTKATLSICRALIPSAKAWEQYHTTLLISSPGKQSGRTLSIEAHSLVQVDPEIDEAASLRRWAQRENCRVNEPFSTDLFDVASTVHAPLRLQFTLASLDGFIRASPLQIHTGYLSVILTSLSIVSLWKRRQLFSMECCGVPIYSNTCSGRCQRCGTTEVCLRINPNLVAEISDETGAVSCMLGPETKTSENRSHTASLMQKRESKILWADEAWAQLLGRTPEQLSALCDISDPAKAQATFLSLRHLEQRLMFMRVILAIGWTGDQLGGRLAVLNVAG